MRPLLFNVLPLIILISHLLLSLGRARRLERRLQKGLPPRRGGRPGQDGEGAAHGPSIHGHAQGVRVRAYTVISFLSCPSSPLSYAKYYYALRGLSTKDPAHFPLKPLDEKDQIKLEERSRGLDKPRRHGPQPKEKPRIKRTVSADSYEMRPKRVILS